MSENLAMLVLSRKKDQVIRIGDYIVVRVISTAGGRVRIGIDAPISIRIQRDEVADPDIEALSSDWESIGSDFSNVLTNLKEGSLAK